MRESITTANLEYNSQESRESKAETVGKRESAADSDDIDGTVEKVKSVSGRHICKIKYKIFLQKKKKESKKYLIMRKIIYNDINKKY